MPRIAYEQVDAYDPSIPDTPQEVVSWLVQHDIDPGNFIAQLQDIASRGAGHSFTNALGNLDTFVGTPDAWEEVIVPTVEYYSELPPVAQVAVRAAVSYFTGGSGTAVASEVAAETATEEVVEQTMWDTLTSWASDAWDTVSGAVSEWWGDDADWSSAIPDDWGVPEIGEAIGAVGSIFSDDGGGAPPAPPPSGGRMVRTGGTMNGNGFDDEGGMMTVGGGAVVAGGIWLGSWLARAFGGAARGVVFKAANGVRVRMGELWPLVRRYGSQAVAGGLGISVGSLGTLLMSPEAMSGRKGKRGRGRGVTARDVKTTTRTLKTIKKLYRLMPTRPSSGRSYGGGYRPRRRRYAHYH